MSSIVYAVHVPSRWDRRTNGMISVDMSPAAEHGELRVIFPGLDRPPSVAQALPAMRQTLAAFTPHDYLVLAGDMDLVVWASVLALKNTGGRLNLLKWDSRSRRYGVMQSPLCMTEIFDCNADIHR